MERRALGSSGMTVSPLCLGTMMFGLRTELQEADRIVGSARETGVNFIDTADVYAAGESERIVGQLIHADRERWVLATKVGSPGADDRHRGGLSRRWVMQAVHDSLARLGTDYIDIYYCHHDDEETPLEETFETLGRLVQTGTIRGYGLSNYRAWRVVEVVHVCARLGVPPPIVCQPVYNAMTRAAEAELLPACAHHGIAVVPYSPLARGVLSGKYLVDSDPPPDSRAGRRDRRMMETEWRRESILLAQELKKHAEAKAMTAGQFALNWVLNNALVTSVIVGPRTFDQWTEYLGALDHGLDAEDEAFVDRLVAPGQVSTPGYSDPRYPPRGRVPRTS